MKNELQIRALLERYDEGLTDADEERQLRLLLAAEESLPRELQAVAAMLGGLDALGEEALPQRLTARQAKPHLRRIGWVAAAAAAIALFVVVDRIGSPYCYINGEPIYDAEDAMATTGYLAHLEHLEHSMALFDTLLFTTEQK